VIKEDFGNLKNDHYIYFILICKGVSKKIGFLEVPLNKWGISIFQTGIV
jgi:hypothetical protein